MENQERQRQGDACLQGGSREQEAEPGEPWPTRADEDGEPEQDESRGLAEQQSFRAATHADGEGTARRRGQNGPRRCWPRQYEDGRPDREDARERKRKQRDRDGQCRKRRLPEQRRGHMLAHRPGWLNARDDGVRGSVDVAARHQVAHSPPGVVPEILPSEDHCRVAIGRQLLVHRPAGNTSSDGAGRHPGEHVAGVATGPQAERASHVQRRTYRTAT